MSKNDTPGTSDDVLSEEELILLSSAHEVIDSVDTESVKMKSLRSKIMAQVDDADKQGFSVQQDLLTIRADSGNWQNVNDKIRKKILHVDERNGIETYLLSIEPGARDAPHVHSTDEHCIVLEGDVTFGDVHLNVGDYHLAPKGSRHEEAHSVHGALLYIQTGVEHAAAM